MENLDLRQIIGDTRAQRAASITEVVNYAIEDLDTELEDAAYTGSQLALLLTAIPIYFLDTHYVNESERARVFSGAAKAIKVISKRSQVLGVLPRLKTCVDYARYGAVSITETRETPLRVPFNKQNVEVDLKSVTTNLASLYGQDEFLKALVEGRNEGIDYILRVSQPEGRSLQPIPLQVAQEFDLLDLKPNPQGELIGHSPTVFKGVEIVYHYSGGQKLPRSSSFLVVPV